MTQIETMADVDRLDFAKGGGVVTVVAQDSRSGAVLMVAGADREALERTLATGDMHYRSRTRGLWRKGETSGNVQRVHTLSADCDGDAILARVIPAGPACHTGETTCFATSAEGSSVGVLAELADIIADRAASTDDAPSYTRKLLADRNLRLKKIGEEAAELVLACADGDRARAAEEAADVIYHAMIALQAIGCTLGDVMNVLAERFPPRTTATR
jgi:phosphoribosyl-ATP pyrophosphohydrolase/phosphoribosyl-AMP cyclohydrolase